jgi:hypothetical protein
MKDFNTAANMSTQNRMGPSVSIHGWRSLENFHMSGGSVVGTYPTLRYYDNFLSAAAILPGETGKVGMQANAPHNFQNR